MVFFFWLNYLHFSLKKLINYNFQGIILIIEEFFSPKVNQNRPLINVCFSLIVEIIFNFVIVTKIFCS